MENVIELFRDSYITESNRKILEIRCITNGIQTGSIDSEQKELILRNMHTLKGNSNIFGEPEIAAISEKLEHIYFQILSNGSKYSEDLKELTNKCLDHIERILNNEFDSGTKISRFK